MVGFVSFILFTFYSEIVNEAIPILQERDDFERIFFQEDGAPCHTAGFVRAAQLATFGERLVAINADRDGGINYPPRSPDLTVCDIWLFAYVKGIIMLYLLLHFQNEKLSSCIFLQTNCDNFNAAPWNS